MVYEELHLARVWDWGAAMSLHDAAALLYGLHGLLDHPEKPRHVGRHLKES